MKPSKLLTTLLLGLMFVSVTVSCKKTAPTATKEAPFINTLGMEFMPVKATPGVLWSRWETRVRDYVAFCLETKRDHKKPDFEQGDDHPVAEVDFNDAQAFCVWLSKKEGRVYRLPTDHEWSCAVGIGATEICFCWQNCSCLR